MADVATAFLVGLLVVGGVLVLTGLIVCAEYRWVYRVEYLWRVERRDWDAFWPVVVPQQVLEELY
ncbi:hypothetical protein KIH74_28950 [Kineosporia sp. J2-2]|uniref:Uncharacterized protein n=1 Tax=Kineosporia corallincola TaxID=2835133 RepID=A0ABS5TQZ5_9ACTN|nr:hypothetical protein [Kineosporia corallincola]MBT0773006.1 hypothetical protein [Kineosporia corallincola]